MSSSTKAFDGVPLGVSTVVVCNHSGAPAATRFWKKTLEPGPAGIVGLVTDRMHHAAVEGVAVLFVHIQQYLGIVLQLDPQERDQLAGVLSGVFERLIDESNDR